MTILGVFYQKIARTTAKLIHDEPDIEQLIREDFDRFTDIYLPGQGNRLMRRRTERLCEEIVRHVLKEFAEHK